MPNVVIRKLHCVNAATGTDHILNQALASLPKKLPMIVADIAEVVATVPGLLEAIDDAQSDPDDLYLTTENAGGLDKRIWPVETKTHSIQSGQLAVPGVTFTFDEAACLSLWDHDWPSEDDLLGSVIIEATEIGQEVMKKAWSDVEGSVYYVHYHVY